MFRTVAAPKIANLPIVQKRNMGLLGVYLVYRGLKYVSTPDPPSPPSPPPRPVYSAKQLLCMTEFGISDPPASKYRLLVLLDWRGDYLDHIKKVRGITDFNWQQKTARAKCMQADYNSVARKSKEYHVREALVITDSEIRNIFGVD